MWKWEYKHVLRSKQWTVMGIPQERILNRPQEKILTAAVITLKNHTISSDAASGKNFVEKKYLEYSDFCNLRLTKMPVIENSAWVERAYSALLQLC